MDLIYMRKSKGIMVGVAKVQHLVIGYWEMDKGSTLVS